MLFMPVIATTASDLPPRRLRKSMPATAVAAISGSVAIWLVLISHVIGPVTVVSAVLVETSFALSALKKAGQLHVGVAKREALRLELCHPDLWFVAAVAGVLLTYLGAIVYFA
jgi:hypothetical protein